VSNNRVVVGSESFGDCFCSTVANLAAAEIDSLDGVVGLEKVGNLDSTIVSERIAREMDIRESAISLAKMFGEGTNSIGGDFVAVEVKECELGLEGNVSGESNGTCRVDLVIFEVEVREAGVSGDSFGNFIGTGGADLVAAEVESLDVELLEHLSNVVDGGIVDGTVDERKGLGLIVSGKSLGNGNCAIFVNGAMIQMKICDGLAGEEGDQACIDALSGSIAALEVIEMGDLGSEEEVP